MEIVLSKALRLFLDGAAPATRPEVLAAVAAEARSLQALAPGPDRAREVHRRVDAAQAQFGQLKPELVRAVRCQRGCSHCCRVRVELTPDEADLLAERVRAGQAEPDRERLERQRTWASAADFIGKPHREADCVFLGADGACTVYADRPSACRAVLVTSDPSLCREAGAGTQVQIVINPYLELVRSAAQTLAAWEGHPPTWMAAALAARL
jgi:Fe-S-cluster containining protein